MPNEIDELMSLDPLSLTKEDISRVVKYLRDSYKTHEQSAKFSKSQSEADRPKLDLSALGLAPAAPTKPLTRRRV